MDAKYFVLDTVLVIFFTIFHKVIGDGEVLVHFHYYTNPTGRLLNGYCCDGWPFCTSRCDLSFSVCVDLPNNWYRTAADCKFGSYTSEKVQENSDQIIFGESFGGLTNPLRFIVPGSINRKVTIKVDVRDVDSSSSNDLVDYISGDFWLYKGPKSEFSYPYDLISRTRLYTMLTIRCAKGWYGDSCRVYCAPPGRTDHYTCDPNTGKKVCVPTWGGPTCSKKLGLWIRTKTKWQDKIKRRSRKAYNEIAKIKYPLA